VSCVMSGADLVVKDFYVNRTAEMGLARPSDI
jgi:hypothetical protein